MIKIIDFIDIKLSLKALKQVIKNQIAFSRVNYLMASDVDISIDSIKGLEYVLKKMEELFGTLEEQQNVCYLKEGKIIENF